SVHAEEGDGLDSVLSRLARAPQPQLFAALNRNFESTATTRAQQHVEFTRPSSSEPQTSTNITGIFRLVSDLSETNCFEARVTIFQQSAPVRKEGVFDPSVTLFKSHKTVRQEHLSWTGLRAGYGSAFSSDDKFGRSCTSGVGLREPDWLF